MTPLWSQGWLAEPSTPATLFTGPRYLRLPSLPPTMVSTRPVFRPERRPTAASRRRARLAPRPPRLASLLLRQQMPKRNFSSKFPSRPCSARCQIPSSARSRVLKRTPVAAWLLPPAAAAGKKNKFKHIRGLRGDKSPILYQSLFDHLPVTNRIKRINLLEAAGTLPWHRI